MGTLPVEEGAAQFYRFGVAVAALVAGFGMLVGAAVYNATSAPPAEVLAYAEIVPLGAGSTASMTSRVELRGPSMVVTSNFVYDPEAQALIPLDGGPRQPLTSGSMDDVAVDGDNIAWTDLQGTPTVNLYDGEHGSVKAVVLPANRTPIVGTLAAGDGWVAWSFAASDGRQGAAVLAPGATAPNTYVSALAENRSVRGVLRTDLFYSKASDRSDLWRLNTTGGREELLAVGLAPGPPATGAFFIAWVNVSSERIEYFDVLDRIVETIPPPSGVTPQWVLADGFTILIGGTKAGFFSSSPRVEFYDFGVGVAHIYDSIGVDFDANPRFGYGDRTVVSLVEERQPRPVAPLAPWIFAGGLVATAVGLGLGLRHTFRADDDL